MKKIIYSLLLLLIPFVGFSQAQKFIKVSGYSQFEMETESIRVIIKITESQRDEFNKIRARSTDEILKEADTALKTMGYSAKDLIEVWPKNSGYNSRNKTTTYYLYVKSMEEAIKVRNLDVKGLKASDYKYHYPDKIAVDNNSLSEKALEDARKRAEYLAGKVNKKIGKIINITDSSKNEYRPTKYNALSNLTIEYNIIVTYELLD